MAKNDTALMSLTALQQNFRTWLETGTEQASARFAPSAQPGLLVYQNNYRAALMACLEESFARTREWLGAQEFKALAVRYIDAFPPNSWSLDHYAAGFPAALAQAAPNAAEAGELAALELALAETFVGPDALAIAPAALGTVAWESAVLRLVPTARLLPQCTNASAIYSSLASGQQAPTPMPLSEPQSVLIWRQQFTSCFRTLVPQEAEIIRELFAGMRFTELCARLVQVLGESQGVQTAGAWLGRWVGDGLLLDIA